MAETLNFVKERLRVLCSDDSFLSMVNCIIADTNHGGIVQLFVMLLHEPRETETKDLLFDPFRVVICFILWL